jgi:hypothetical protein
MAIGLMLMGMGMAAMKVFGERVARNNGDGEAMDRRRWKTCLYWNYYHGAKTRGVPALQLALDLGTKMSSMSCTLGKALGTKSQDAPLVSPVPKPTDFFWTWTSD